MCVYVCVCVCVCVCVHVHVYVCDTTRTCYITIISLAEEVGVNEWAHPVLGLSALEEAP